MIVTTCSKHRLPELPDAKCATCERITTEALIVTRTVEALLAAGYILNVNNGGDADELEHYSDNREAVLRVMMDTDEDWLLARRPFGADTTFVMFVYGNDGWDVISDYGMTLEPVLEPVRAYAETLEPSR